MSYCNSGYIVLGRLRQWVAERDGVRRTVLEVDALLRDMAGEGGPPPVHGVVVP